MKNGIVTKVLGSLNYEVTVDGHSHQAHIDHLLPGVSTLDVKSPTPNNEQADQKHDEHDATTTDNTIVPLEVENDPLHESREQEVVTLRQTRKRHPPMRLIEEINYLVNTKRYLMHMLHVFLPQHYHCCNYSSIVVFFRGEEVLCIIVVGINYCTHACTVVGSSVRNLSTRLGQCHAITT